MKSAFTILFSFFLFITVAQEKYRKTITGKLSLRIFSKDAELKKWFVREYESYQTDKATLKSLKYALADKKIVVVLGTWCSDSQREFPRLLKVLNNVSY